MSCEACRALPAVEEVSERPELPPFRLCGPCARRVHTLALRPSEWFSLAVRHGASRFYLHDDFYDDSGCAHQPAEPVEDAEAHPAPTLSMVQGRLPQLVDYASTRWKLDGETATALAAHPATGVVKELERRLFDPAQPPTSEMVGASLAILADAVGGPGAELVRRLWGMPFEPWGIHGLAEASAACLPEEEGFARVVGYLDSLSPKGRREHCEALDCFRSPKALDWLERTLASGEVVLAASWGRLAATSGLTWSRIERWFAAGRPLSLVGLDALIYCFNYETPLLRELSPKLRDAPAFEVASAALTRYAERDPVPRVERAVAAIREHWSEIRGP